jgi:hypothetical protein
MPNFEERLARLDHLIATFERIVVDYPNSEAYAESLASLRRDRAELANTIGK